MILATLEQWAKREREVSTLLQDGINQLVFLSD